MTAVNGGTLLLSIAGDRTLHLEGLVDENEIPRVAIDQPARIRTEAYPDRVFEGARAPDYRFENERIIEEWYPSDQVSLLSGIGAM